MTREEDEEKEEVGHAVLIFLLCNFFMVQLVVGKVHDLFYSYSHV